MRLGWIALLVTLGCSSQDGAEPARGGIVDAGGRDAADGGGGGAGAPPFAGPAKLSDTGLYADIASRSLAAGVLEYSVQFPLWSDGLEKRRYLSLPENTQIDTSEMDLWSFPVGTRAWKEFRDNGRPLETRYLEKLSDAADDWLMVSYLWDDAGLDATPVPQGVVDAASTTHDLPSQDQCHECHVGASDTLIGVSAIQLSTDQGNGFLSQLASEGRLTNPPAAEFQVPGAGAVKAAIGYLHGNCGNCHNNEHFLATRRALRLKLLVGAATPEDTPLYQTAINGKMNHDIDGTTIGVVPGKPGESQLYNRLSRRDLLGMPPLGSEVADTAASQTVAEWITGLAP